MRSPRVSVVLPVHDAAPWLERCVRSVLDQTMSDLELLAIDDASTDESWSILQRMANGDERLVVRRSSTNRGPGASRNAALDLVRGTWLTFIDADDAWTIDRLARLLRVAEDEPADVVADAVEWVVELNGRFVPFRIGNRMGRWWLRRPTECIEAGEWIRRGVILKPLMRREPIAELRQDESLWSGQDYVYFVEAIDCSGGQLGLVRAPLYRYTIRPGSVRSTPGRVGPFAIALEELSRRASLSPSTRDAVRSRLAMLAVEQEVDDWVATIRSRHIRGSWLQLKGWNSAHVLRLAYLVYRSIRYRTFLLCHR